jgi:hypothetical protein
MPAADNTFRGMLELLKTATERNQLNWERTADASEYRARAAYGFVRFARYPEVPSGVFSPDATPGRFTITLVTDDNTVLECFFPLSEEDVAYALRFFSLVRRLALNIGHLYDTMLADLRQRANQPS